MDGIEILNQVDALTYDTRLLMFLITLVAYVVMTFILSAFFDEFNTPMYVCTDILIISAICTAAEVIIDDSVSFTELYEKYDVIEQKGKIWILEDKEE